jgi:ATP-dependent exoDNAse (exonuclease V) beta subunit
MTGTADRAQRQAALDGSRSFVVQAPAGSGKTELLIQRYLKLLLSVHEPEQIVAITFTRKAAAEMRGRVVAALRLAATGMAPSRAHEAQTHSLAESVLARDTELAWGLLEQTQRLRIDTLDALNAWLARQLPLLSGGVAAASIEEQAEERYRQAARRTLDRLSAEDRTGAALRRLMRLLDNSMTRLESLLADLLPKRDQWLGYLLGEPDEALRVHLEEGLHELVREPIDELEMLCPPQVLETIQPLLNHAGANTDDSALADAARTWSQGASLPAGTAERLIVWRGVARLLQTATGTWRRQITKTLGFARTDAASKQMLRDLLADLEPHESLRLALATVPELPEPRYGNAQWNDLLALRTVLLHAAAELRVTFAAHGCVDFVELALAAQQALGEVDEPSELLLALDRRIQHILIDEFQDTSKTQLRLLELLTAGWQTGDGRSLFLVGDPMQSIYRFRDADMSLFLRAKQHGIGQVACEPLQLTANFRSAPAIVDWVNRAFAAIFPQRDSIGQAQARFHASAAERPAGVDQAVHLHCLSSADEYAELQRVLDILRRERDRDEHQSIAILVQSRSHLLGLHQRLQALGLPVHAVEIDSVAESQVGQDLLGLTRALSHLDDRLAWLAVLRAPWCGLSWADLENLCGDDRRTTVWQLMHDAERLAGLGSDGRQRVAALRHVMQATFAAAGLQSFARWVERCWRDLDGPLCLRDADEATVAAQFFKGLAQLSGNGGPIEPATLEQAFTKAQGQAGTPGESGIEVMTIHRAKGLEFDTVILFGLARAPRREDNKALYWMERSGKDRGKLVLAPLQADDDPLSRFLRRDEHRREQAERARVLYVATTRARERLHLVCRLDPDSETIPGRSLLSWLWPSLSAAFLAERQEVSPPVARQRWLQPTLTRFADGYDQAQTDSGRFDPAAGPDTSPRPEFEWAGQTAVRVGTIVHRELHTMSELGLEHCSAQWLQGRVPSFKRQLALLGVEPRELPAAAVRVREALENVLADVRGRWILGPHSAARSELRVTLRGGGILRHAQLDRTFVDEDGTRWIIDYKTSSHEGADLDAFLASEVSRYRAQLEAYAAFMNEIEPRPTRVALYFPLLEAFRDWAPGSAAEQLQLL